jgi:hypothetical protein
MTDAAATTAPTVWETPPPVLFNVWKHHAGALRHSMAETVAAGPAALTTMARQCIVLGTELMDLYLGPLLPREIGEHLLAHLRAEQRLSLDPYRLWIEGNRGYRVVTLEQDATPWVLRLGAESERWVHIHPGRWAPRTCRVRATVLKTAVMSLTYTALHGGDAMDLAIVNHVRRDFLELPPLGRALAAHEGIGQMIQLLRDLGGT